MCDAREKFGWLAGCPAILIGSQVRRESALRDGHVEQACSWAGNSELQIPRCLRKKVGPIHIFLLRLYVTTRDRRDDVHVTSALREREGGSHILIKGREVA